MLYNNMIFFLNSLVFNLGEQHFSSSLLSYVQARLALLALADIEETKKFCRELNECK